jgi:glutaminyl-tRNA synthetase
LEFCIREDLNKNAFRKMVVFNPLKIVLTNYKEQDEMVSSENNPENEYAGHREIPFGRELFIEREDFMETPPRKFFRLAPGKKVRLKSAYIIECDEVIKDETGQIVELRCRYLPESRSGNDVSGLKIQGTLHWVSAKHAIPVELRLYDRLFMVEDPASEVGDFKDYINPDSLTVIKGAVGEPSLSRAEKGQSYQFLRKGYFCMDPDSTQATMIFNMTVGLKDSWAKEQKKN